MDRWCSDSKITLLKVVLCTGDLFIWEVIKGQQPYGAVFSEAVKKNSCNADNPTTVSYMQCNKTKTKNTLQVSKCLASK